MEFVILAKQIPDLDQVRLHTERRTPVFEGVPLVLDDLSRNAAEAAVQLKEKHGGHVTVLTLGTPAMRKGLREILAMGADDAVLVTAEPALERDPRSKATILAAAIRQLGKGDLLLLGEGSADGYSSQTGPRLAHALGFPYLSYAREVRLEQGSLQAVRDLEEGLETVAVPLPAIVSVTNEINTPRLPPLPKILQATKKPVAEWPASERGLPSSALEASLSELANRAPETPRKRLIFEGPEEESPAWLLEGLQKDGVLGR